MHQICHHIPFFPPPNFFNQNYENFAYTCFALKFSTSPPLDAALCTSNQSNPCLISDSQTPSIVVQPRIDNFNLNEPLNVDGGEKHQAWTLEHDRMLVKAWSTISTYNVVGNGQNKKAF